MNMRYAILSRTPCPGYWEALPTCFIQEAEFNLRFGRTYHDTAVQVGHWLKPLYLYTWEDANQIVDFQKERRPWGEYRLLGYVER